MTSTDERRSMSVTEKSQWYLVTFALWGRVSRTKATPIFVLRDHWTRITFAHVCEGKIIVDAEYSDYLRNAVMQEFSSMGHAMIVFKTNGEPACKALQEHIKTSRDSTTILEKSPVGVQRGC